MASWTRVTNVFKLKEKGFPNCPNPVCTSENTLRTHTRVIVAGRDGNSMFGCEIIKRAVQVSVSAVGSCTEASGWRFESVSVPCDVPRQFTSSAGILTSPRFAQSKPERRRGLQFTHRFELSVVIGE